jgi:hypothetical protein
MPETKVHQGICIIPTLERSVTAPYSGAEGPPRKKADEGLYLSVPFDLHVCEPRSTVRVGLQVIHFHSQSIG